MLTNTDSEAYTCYISLGANLGDRAANLRQALRLLTEAAGIRLIKTSYFYETSPWGKLDQPPFINAAAELKVNINPLELLAACQQIELKLGRERHETWGARTIDIDLLHIPNVTYDTKKLILPHPYMLARSFVLKPLAEIAGDMLIAGRTINEHSRLCQDDSSVMRYVIPFPLKLIACVVKKWGIGRGRQLLLKLPSDMALFRQRTLGQVVVMGRETMISLPGGKPLAGRQNIVLSRTLKDCPGFKIYNNINSLLTDLPSLAIAEELRNIFVIGGETVYHELLPYVDEAFITYIPIDMAADKFMVDLDWHSDFTRASTEKLIDSSTEISYELRHYIRVQRNLPKQKN